MSTIYRYRNNPFGFFLYCLMFITTFSIAQPSAFEKGLLLVKVTPALAQQLEETPLENSNGIVSTGIAALDRFANIYKVSAMKRVFPAAGKFEARHKQYGLDRWYELRVTLPNAELQAINAYQSLWQIEKAEPVYKKARIGLANDQRVIVVDVPTMAPPLTNTPSDPLFNQQWHYHNTGQTNGTNGADIRLREAWKVETGKKEVVVSVHDGGVDVTHPDLVKNLWVNTGEIPGNGIDDDNNGYVDDVHGYNFVYATGDVYADDHGTHVAGTIAATTNNGIGVAGVAGGSGNNDGVRVMSCAVFADWDAGGFAESYVYAADNGAVISQNSWGYLGPDFYEQAVIDAIDYFIAVAGKDVNGVQHGLMDGGLVIFASGNSDSDLRYYPGYYEKTFAVAATTHKDTKAWYSNYGSWVDIAAPGGETNGIEEEGVLSTLSYNRYGYFQGTSMACPHVSGLAALVLSRYGRAGFKPQMLRDRIRYSSTSINSVNPGYVNKLGIGRINAAKALEDGDVTPPGAITNLVVTNSVVGKVTLQWTVPNDAESFVASYDIRYSTSPITPENFSAATSAGDAVANASAGTVESFTVTRLPGGTMLYFAVKAIDFFGNTSAMSNVIQHTTELAPAIVVTPLEVAINLQTAQEGTESFTIQNTGPGTLIYSIVKNPIDNDFVKYLPITENLASGQEKLITVTFSARNKLAGRYERTLMIKHNDPLKDDVAVSLVMNVTNNNAPIASVAPAELLFKSLKIGTAFTKAVTFYNAGSNSLTLSNITIDNNDYSTVGSGSITIPAFQSYNLLVTFSPSATGIRSGLLTVQTNDTALPVLSVPLTGEGLTVEPIVVTPAAIHQSLGQGETAQQVLKITNNGSFESHYSIQVKGKGIVSKTPSFAKASETTTRLSTAEKTTNVHRTKNTFAEQLMHKVMNGEVKIDVDAKPVAYPKADTKTKDNAMARTAGAAMSLSTSPNEYATDFEEFSPGRIDGQQNWYSLPGWDIDNKNASSPSQHLSGTITTAGEYYCISPNIFPDMEEYSTTTSMSVWVNASKSQGARFEVIPQDPWSYVAARIRFNADQTIDVMSVTNDYDIVWTRIDFPIPDGYFEIGMELDGYGDGSSGFPVFDLYFDNKKVFRGYSLGSVIGEVAFLSVGATAGPVFDIDDLRYAKEGYIPKHITATPSEGIIGPGKTVDIPLTIDATSLRFGIYSSDIIVNVDDMHRKVIPATVEVTGEPGISVDPSELLIEGFSYEYVTTTLDINNRGGSTVEYKIQPTDKRINIWPTQGTVKIGGKAKIYIETDFLMYDPAIYFDTLTINTNVPGRETVKVPMRLTIWEEEADFLGAGSVRIYVPKGDLISGAFKFWNEGTKKVYYKLFYDNDGAMQIDAPEGFVEDEKELTITVDSRLLEEGTHQRYVHVYTNDPYNSYNVMHVTIIVEPSNEKRGLTREEWANVEGRKVSTIPLNTPPTTIDIIEHFDAPVNKADHYGARIRGYVMPPVTGYYTFFLSSDDQSQLFLGDSLNNDKRLIAHLNAFVPRGNYDAYTTQRSQPQYLQGGKKYYVEALHKENTGKDHLSVGWELPNQSREFPIPRTRLYPFEQQSNANENPVVMITAPTTGQTFQAPTEIMINAEATDLDGHVIRVEFFLNGTLLRADATWPYSFTLKMAPAGNHTITATAYDNKGGIGTASTSIVVLPAPCDATGDIYAEIWRNAPGRTIADIPLHRSPDRIMQLTQFETTRNLDNDYGARVRGYLCVQQTGLYTFWISSDDHSELYLSTSENPDHKTRIAFVKGFSGYREWNKFSSQQSQKIMLEAGRKYYIEALHKESQGGDHLSVGWELPNGTLERPIAGNRLINHYSIPAQANSEVRAYADDGMTALASKDDGVLYPNPTSTGDVFFQASEVMDDEEVALTVHTPAGKTIKEEVLSCSGCARISFTVDDHLPAGVYIVKIQTKVKQYIKRLVVK